MSSEHEIQITVSLGKRFERERGDRRESSTSTVQIPPHSRSFSGENKGGKGPRRGILFLRSFPGSFVIRHRFDPDRFRAQSHRPIDNLRRRTH